MRAEARLRIARVREEVLRELCAPTLAGAPGDGRVGAAAVVFAARLLVAFAVAVVAVEAVPPALSHVARPVALAVVDVITQARVGAATEVADVLAVARVPLALRREALVVAVAVGEPLAAAPHGARAREYWHAAAAVERARRHVARSIAHRLESSRAQPAWHSLLALNGSCAWSTASLRDALALVRRAHAKIGSSRGPLAGALARAAAAAAAALHQAMLPQAACGKTARDEAAVPPCQCLRETTRPQKHPPPHSHRRSRHRNSRARLHPRRVAAAQPSHLACYWRLARRGTHDASVRRQGVLPRERR